MPRVAFIVAFASVWLYGRTACAERSAITISAPESGCPSRELVREQLVPLVGARAIGFAEGSDSTAIVRDDGDRYSIVVAGGARREVTDTTQNCLERARVAAVFIAMNLPAVSREERPPPKEARPEPKPKEPVKGNAQRDGVQRDGVERDRELAVQARFEAAVAPEYGAVALGLSAGPSLTNGAWELALLLGFSGPTTLSGLGVDSAESVELLRLPARLTLAYLFRTGTVALGPEIGAFGGALRIRGDQVPNPDGGWRFEAGPMAGAALRWRPRERFAVGASVDLLFVPHRYDLVVGPERGLGQTPAVWLLGGISLAYTF